MLLDLLPPLHANAKDFHFPSAGKEDLGRLERANANIPGQRLVSAKCWHCFIALSIMRVTGGPSTARGPDLPSSSHTSMASEGHTVKRRGISHRPDLVTEVVHPRSTTRGSASGFFSQVVCPRPVCCRGLAAWSTAASQISSATIS